MIAMPYFNFDSTFLRIYGMVIQGISENHKNDRRRVEESNNAARKFS